MTNNHSLDSPEGFILHELSPQSEQFLTMLGPWYYKNVPADNGHVERVFGIRIEPKHTNIWGTAHGGMLISMADSALGYNLSRSTEPPQKLVTVHLSSDFMASPKPNDWVETEFRISKIGKRMSFAECSLKVGNKIMLRTSGVFTVLNQLKKVQND